MATLVHLKAPGGGVIGFTLPLHSTIEKQWRQGELTRVTEDGAPWDASGDDPDALTEAGEREAGEYPERPAPSAHKRHWQDYAVAIGACSGDDAEQMTKAQLVDLVTPPEEKPADPDA